MDSLCAYNEGSMGRMAVAICSILAAKVFCQSVNDFLCLKAYYSRKCITVKISKLY